MWTLVELHTTPMTWGPCPEGSVPSPRSALYAVCGTSWSPLSDAWMSSMSSWWDLIGGNLKGFAWESFWECRACVVFNKAGSKKMRRAKRFHSILTHPNIFLSRLKLNMKVTDSWLIVRPDQCETWKLIWRAFCYLSVIWPSVRFVFANVS